jgi:hypothetical protein
MLWLIVLLNAPNGACKGEGGCSSEALALLHAACVGIATGDHDDAMSGLTTSSSFKFEYLNMPILLLKYWAHF